MNNRKKPQQYRCEFFVWSIFQREGVWYANGRGHGQRLGKYSLGTRNLDTALANLKRLDRQKAVERRVADPQPPSSDDKVSIKKGWADYLEHRDGPGFLGGLSSNSRRRYGQARKKHEEFCVSQRIHCWNEVDEDHVQRYGKWLHRKGHAERGAYLLIVILQAVHRWLIKQKCLPASARFSLQLARPEGTETYCFRREEVADMIRHCRTSVGLEWLAQVVVVLACTGLRISELVGLRWSDVDLQSGMIVLTDERASHRRSELGSARRVKGKRTRRIPISAQVHQLFSDLPRHADGLVLHDQHNRPLMERRVRAALIQDVITPLASKFPTPTGEIGFEHGRLHSFRHFFVSECFRQGAMESEIMSWTGHRDPKLVALYRHLRQEDGIARMSRIQFLPDTANGPTTTTTV